MEWMALVTLLLKFFESLPAILELLKKLFANIEVEGNPSTLDPMAGMERLFRAARAKLWWFQFVKRARLDTCERIAVKRASEFWMTMMGSDAPKMTLVEWDELSDV